MTDQDPEQTQTQQLPPHLTLLEFVEMYLQKGVKLQPFQKDLLQRLETFQEEVHQLGISTSVEIRTQTRTTFSPSAPDSRRRRVVLEGHKVVALEDHPEDSSGSTFLTMTVGPLP